jgi:hypothetical protein
MHCVTQTVPTPTAPDADTLVKGGRYTWGSWAVVRGQGDGDVYIYNDYTIIRGGSGSKYVDFVMDGRGQRLGPFGSTDTIPAHVLTDIRATYRPDSAPTTPARPILSRPGETTLEVGRLTLKSSRAGVLTVVRTGGVYSECITHPLITCHCLQ